MSYINHKTDLITIPLKKLDLVQPKLELNQESSSEVNPEELLMKTEKHCERLLQEVYQERERHLKELQEEIVQLKEDAYKETYKIAYEEGYQIGIKEAKQVVSNETMEYIEDLKKYCFQLQNESRKYIDSLTDELVSVIKQSVEKVTFQVIKDPSTTILPLVRDQLKEINTRQQIFIRVHPECYEEIKNQEHQLKELCTNGRLYIISDLNLTLFGCVLETENELIDLQLDKQFVTLFNELERVVRES